MKKILLLLLTFNLGLHAWGVKDIKKLQNAFMFVDQINSNLPAKLAAAKTAVANYKAKKCTLKGKKLSEQQCLAVTLDAIGQALAAFTYPALGNYETKTPGLAWTLVNPYAKQPKGSKKKEMYLGILKATRELSEAVDAIEVVSFLMFPGMKTGDTSTAPKITPVEIDEDELDDLLDDLD